MFLYFNDLQCVHTPGKMLQRPEAGTNPIVCADRTHVVGTVQVGLRKAHVGSFPCAAVTVLNNSAHDVALKI